jgi:hypothetical protein
VQDMKALKSFGAIAAGFVAIVVLSLGMDIGVYAAWGVPPFSRPLTDPLFLLAVAYRALFGAAGGWIAAKLAPGSPLRHAVALGVLGLVLSGLGIVETWNKPDLGPRWYSVAVAAVTLPSAWVGGRLRRVG